MAKTCNHMDQKCIKKDQSSIVIRMQRPFENISGTPEVKKTQVVNWSFSQSLFLKSIIYFFSKDKNSNHILSSTYPQKTDSHEKGGTVKVSVYNFVSSLLFFNINYKMVALDDF